MLQWNRLRHTDVWQYLLIAQSVLLGSKSIQIVSTGTRMVQLFERAVFYCYRTILRIICSGNERRHTPFRLLVIALAGWLSRQQQAVIDYLIEKLFLIMDQEGVKPVRCPVRAPNCNAFAERFVRSIKEECLDRMILFGEASLRRALREYIAHNHNERNHQSVDNRLLQPLDTSGSANEQIYRRERLGGMLNCY